MRNHQIIRTPRKPAPAERSPARALLAANSGAAIVEFALGLPLVMMLSVYGLEFANLANANRKISQVTMAVADNMSRIGLDNSLASGTQVREVDINDALTGGLLEAQGMNLNTQGRIIISSLEAYTNSQNQMQQYIHWQRCIGATSYNGDSFTPKYGVQWNGYTNKPAMPNPAGMGPTGAVVSDPTTSNAVIYVEVYYDYTPLFPALFSSTPVQSGIFGAMKFDQSVTKLHYTAAYVVRDHRDLTGPTVNGLPNEVYNTENVTSNTC